MCGELYMAKLQDLTGQVFGRLTVLERAENSKSGRSRWRCLCECGNECIVQSSNLKNGNSKSCGCLIQARSSDCHLIDLTGQVFGRLTVLYRVDDYVSPSGNHSSMWRCRCECGNEVDIIGANLCRGKSKSCGCLRNEMSSYRFLFDLTGQRFGRLVVLSRADDIINPGGTHSVAYNCICDCGNSCIVRGQSLYHGVTKSCGCLQKETMRDMLMIDLTGVVFGKLHVIGVDDMCPDNVVRWRCKCECGNEVSVPSYNLRNGFTKSCGCMRSLCEYYVIQYFGQYGVKYDYQKRYDDLYGVHAGYLSFDFLVYKNDMPYCLIECQGEQHYKPVDYFGGEIQFEIQQEHDRRKREYAEAIGVPLLEIPYIADTYEKVAEILQQAGI